MKKILILAANPRKDLNLDREIRDLKRVIESSQNHEDFQVIHEPAVRVGDLQELLLKHRPQIVHFCGHGGGETGLMFESDIGREQQVGTDALSKLFKLFASHVECVLLNACYSEVQANSIVKHIAYVIGMNQAIRDDAAIAFSKGFYRALGYASSIEDAYKFGCNAIQLEISGSVVVRSATTDVGRKLSISNVVENTAMPEHLKPAIKRNPKLVAKLARIAQKQQAALQLDIDTVLKADNGIKSNPDRGSRRSHKAWWMIGGLAIAVLTVGLVGSRLVLPGIARNYTQKGLEQFNSGDRKNAENNYQWAIRLDPNNPKAHLYLGVLYEATQQLDQAQMQYEFAVRQDEYTAANNLARLYILKQQSGRAEGLLMNALQLEQKFDPATKEETRYAILKNLGWAKLEQGDYPNAGDYLQKAIALKDGANFDENLAAPHCLLAQVYEKQGEPQEANAEWGNCLIFADSSNPDENKWSITAQQKVDQADMKGSKTHNVKAKKSN
jgi:Tfp pilus assembly protein PilF